jgi:hypothetical protein
MATSIEKEKPDTTVIEEVNKSNNPVVDVLDLDAQIQQLAKECPPFYKNANLLKLYLLIIPGCLVPSLTLGFDGAMMNGCVVDSTITNKHELTESQPGYKQFLHVRLSPVLVRAWIDIDERGCVFQ